MDVAALILSLAIQAAELQRPRISESVTVMAASSSIAVPAAVTTLGRADLETVPAGTLDDALRAVPGFSLFRRSSSRVANPTTQGATLRGLAASGSSRALVLADGIPLNDPVGGWVYWNRVPAVALQEASVARGAAGDIYGADALGGVISLRGVEAQGARVLVEAGSDATARMSAYGGAAYRRGMLFGSAEGFITDGFVTVAPEARGPIDTRAGSRHASAHAAADVATGVADVALRGSHFVESRKNGTPVQVNSTRVSVASVRVSAEAPRGGVWMGSAYASTQEYEQTFSAVLAGRASERQTSAQVVGATAAGAQADSWWTPHGRPAQIGLQAAVRYVSADLTETPFTVAGEPLAPNRTDAHQFTASGAAQAQRHWRRLSAGGGLRADVWSAGSANRHVVLNPKVWATYAPTGPLRLRAAVQSGFRGPTINELYRGFRVGNIVTDANPDLRPERARGVEGGAAWTTGGVTLRALGFWSRVDDAIVNVTLSSSGSVILRERQNAARIRAAGAEVEAEWRLSGRLVVTAASAFTDSTFSEGPLAGLRVPQVARVQHAIGARASTERLRLSLDWRYIGEQFDDDRNVFALGGSPVMDARAGWRMTKSAEVFAAMENTFDEEQDVGRTPLRTIGLPRTTRVGVRVVFP